MREPKLKLREFPPPRPSGKATWLGYAASLLSRLHVRRRHKATSAELRKHDFPASTQRMGIRFTERIRDTFRFRWIKRSH
jgi:hypothetical protein